MVSPEAVSVDEAAASDEAAAEEDALVPVEVLLPQPPSYADNAIDILKPSASHFFFIIWTTFPNWIFLSVKNNNTYNLWP